MVKRKNPTWKDQSFSRLSVNHWRHTIPLATYFGVGLEEVIFQYFAYRACVFMVWTISNKVSLNIQSTVSRIIAKGTLTRQEHIQLSSVLLADQKITDEERRQINRVFDYLQTGRLKVVG